MVYCFCITENVISVFVVPSSSYISYYGGKTEEEIEDFLSDIEKPTEFIVNFYEILRDEIERITNNFYSVHKYTVYYKTSGISYFRLMD